MSVLLPFHTAILDKVHDPATSELVLLARGLGLRRIVCKLLQIYDSPHNLVLLVNATPEEEAAIGEELGIMGCRNPGLRIVGFETGRKDRQDLYKKGGLVSITSQIFTVDMLTSDIPTHLITGILILHAERVTPTSAEAFIVRLYREKNKKGFLKAFSDQPEHITSGMSPLRTIMKELQLRTVHIYPRFHADIKESLDRKAPDIVELHQEMTEPMSEIHHAIVQCMSTTLAELKRANTALDLDDLTIDNAYFRSFDIVVRRILDPVWHKVGPRTKQLVSDLATLRRLLTYLLAYDALAFHAYLETLIAANTTTDSGAARHHQSPWMLTDAANVIFQYAKRRCYVTSAPSKPALQSAQPSVINLVDDLEDEWAILDEMEAEVAGRPSGSSGKGKERQRETRKPWLPDGMEPVLEELPKWSLLADVLQEIEEEMMRREPMLSSHSPGTNTVLVMASSLHTCTLIKDFLHLLDADVSKGSQGRRMMEDKLKLYLWWKGKLSERKAEGKRPIALPKSTESGDSEVSEALKRKDRERQERQANRRRVRGGAPVAAATRDKMTASGGGLGDVEIKSEADDIAAFLSAQSVDLAETALTQDFQLFTMDDDFDTHYGLLAPAQTVLVRPYSDDSDDQVLQEIKPRFIVMYEPNLEFIRRIEVYRNSNAGLGVRVYFMMYKLSCEEGKYLTGLRREKESFERLIKERGSMLMPIHEDRTTAAGEALIKTISTRIAGGRKEASIEPARVIVDMREFRSSLPSLLHASGLLVLPVTLTVGDYILTPDICVERKSIPDLVSSFNSGRLYTQCELMSAHYKQPILLIEFEEHKSFSLEAVADAKSYAKTSKYAVKKKQDSRADTATIASQSIQSKLVLLTLTFPRVRIIWSSSPYATAEIFNDLKTHAAQPDPAKAVLVGAEEDPQAGAGFNAAAEELLRSLPGITAKNVKHVVSRVRSVRELCDLEMKDMQELLGVEPGKACWEFIHRGERAQARG
ncbi:hypothetical protein DICSQDRAFT_87823 [Dichomitus squalens LYAD-421 SS1]|uniref:ERCC4 domain-containing protein n=1 Tax=Dichomitus squalens (strain LYAD-421) TaxID=732165 RepID=R7SX10_DICSQ|nr:uncharacterized protein DICSQDRAFT_87823 [Dichomitus squalens LYAD-421 SS1]EJF60626.1 hypothetical protein DICSQDRAFT_87823 [Dichomitus squalens LYAD-421 SS1]